MVVVGVVVGVVVIKEILACDFVRSFFIFSGDGPLLNQQ